MKQLLSILGILIALGAQAQDIIRLKDGTTMTTNKVYRVDEHRVEYEENGSLHDLDLQKVKSIETIKGVYRRNVNGEMILQPYDIVLSNAGDTTFGVIQKVTTSFVIYYKNTESGRVLSSIPKSKTNYIVWQGDTTLIQEAQETGIATSVQQEKTVTSAYQRPKYKPYQDTMIDVVYRTNGHVFYGQITWNSSRIMRFTAVDGTKYVFSQSRVDRFEIDKYTPSEYEALSGTVFKSNFSKPKLEAAERGFSAYLKTNPLSALELDQNVSLFLELPLDERFSIELGTGYIFQSWNAEGVGTIISGEMKYYNNSYSRNNRSAVHTSYFALQALYRKTSFEDSYYSEAIETMKFSLKVGKQIEYGSFILDMYGGIGYLHRDYNETWTDYHYWNGREVQFGQHYTRGRPTLLLGLKIGFGLGRK
jgi:hypothetical protein